MRVHKHRWACVAFNDLSETAAYLLGLLMAEAYVGEYDPVVRLLGFYIMDQLFICQESMKQLNYVFDLMLIKKTKNKKPKPQLERSNHEKPKSKPKARWELDKDYIQARINLTNVREKSATLLLAKAREELIETELVNKQAAFMLTSMRQKFLSIPTTYARRLLHKSDINEVVLILKEAVNNALREVAEFPKRVVDPNWLQSIDEE